MELKKLFFLLLFMPVINSEICHGQTWVQKAPVPGGNRLAPFTFVINDKIYLGGGEQTDMWQYDVQTDTWTQKANLQGVTKDRTFAVSFTLNGKGYVGGGADGSYHSGAIDMDDLWEYDPATDKWAKKNDLPSSDQRGIFMLNSKVYMLCIVNYQPALFEYDAANDNWIARKGHPGKHLFNPYVFSVNNKGYIMGGNDSIAGIKKTYEYDPATDSWKPKADFIASEREAGVAFTVGGKGYIGFGADYNFQTYYNDFYVYDPVADKWAAAGTYPQKGRSFAVAAVVNNKAYIGSGWSIGLGGYYKDWQEFTVPAAGIEAHSHDEVTIYPHPVKGLINLVLRPGVKLNKYVLTDISGQKASSGFVQDNQIDIQKLPAGTYVLQLMGEQVYYRIITVSP